MMTSPEAYYVQTCYACGEVLSLVHFHRASVNRTCTRCFAEWLEVPLHRAARAMAMHALRLYPKLAREAARQ